MERVEYLTIEDEDCSKELLHVVATRCGHELSKKLRKVYGVKTEAETVNNNIRLCFDYPCKHISSETIKNIAEDIIKEIKAVYKTLQQIQSGNY